MESKNIQHSIIVSVLIQNGLFAISDIQNKSMLSREGVGKRLRKLVKISVLQKTAQKGAGVRYKLAVNNQAIGFLFENIEQVSINEIALAWNVSVSSAKKYIKKFVDSGIINKRGKPPQKIIYTYAQSNSEDKFFSKEQKDIINKYYIHTTPDGRLFRGTKGFLYWVKNKSGREDIRELADEYISVRKKYYDNKIGVLMIDATDKLEKVFGRNDIYIDKLLHRDFDALPIFGKTYLSQKVRTAKSGRTNTALMNDIVNRIQDSVDNIVRKYDIDCVGFIPPTVSRKTQLMTFMAKRLSTDCNEVEISKVKSLVPVQQKSLKKIEDRVLNAQKTIIVESEKKYENVLLIDDVTGSGATLNETAKKIIQKKIAKNVYGFTITGSAKAGVFDIVSEA